MQSLRLRAPILAVCIALLLSASAQAQAVSLATLFQGGSITVDDIAYTDWTLTKLQTANGGVADFDRIFVDSVVDDQSIPGLGFFSGVAALGTPRIHDGISSVLLTFAFNAQTTSGIPRINGNSVEIQGLNFFSRNQAFARVIEDVGALAGNQLAESAAIVERDDPNDSPRRRDAMSFQPQSFVHIDIQIDVIGPMPNDLVELNSFELQLTQTVPEPDGLALVGMLVTGFFVGFRARRNPGERGR